MREEWDGGGGRERCDRGRVKKGCDGGGGAHGTGTDGRQGYGTGTGGGGRFRGIEAQTDV